MRKSKLLRSGVLLASIFFVSAIVTSNISALAQLSEGSSISNSNSATSTSMLNQTASTEEQNKTGTCAPQFNGTMVNIPRSNEATPSAQDRTKPTTLH